MIKCRGTIYYRMFNQKGNILLEHNKFWLVQSWQRYDDKWAAFLNTMKWNWIQNEICFFLLYKFSWLLGVFIWILSGLYSRSKWNEMGNDFPKLVFPNLTAIHQSQWMGQSLWMYVHSEWLLAVFDLLSSRHKFKIQMDFEPQNQAFIVNNKEVLSLLTAH